MTLIAVLVLGISAAFADGASAATAERVGTSELVAAQSETAQPIYSLSAAKVDYIKPLTYNGKKRKPSPVVRYGSKLLKKDVDYTLSYEANKNAGTARIKIAGLGSYVGTKTVTFKIKRVSISKAKIKSIGAKKYTGKAIKPSPKVTFHGTKLKKKVDYKLSYKKNKKPGTAKVIVKGKGNFKGKRVVKFKIKQSSSSGSGGTVYITKTGAKYHRSGCTWLRWSRIPISRSEAIRRGYGACKVCRP